jgi:hypothetical protein
MKMAKKNKRKLLFTTVILSLLFISSTYAVLIPNVHAAEMTPQQKGLSILSNVVGLDLAKYTVTTKENQTGQTSYVGVVPQENVLYTLESNGNKIDVLYTFANGNVQIIHVLENEGTPNLTKTATSTNAVELAKGFLSEYQTYTANPLFGELKSTLNNVDPNKNLTKTSGNTALEVSAINDYTMFKWYYTSNGVISPYSKAIALGFKDGFLTAFVDNWQLYNVGSTTVNLSKEEAITIALNSTKTHAYSLNLSAYAFEAKNINESNVRWTSLIFDGSLDANKTRSEDPLELYPVWRVGVALDKWYGEFYGIQVDIWADTGEVRAVQEAWSTLPPPEGTPIAKVSTVGEPTSQVSDVNATNSSNDQEPAVSEAKPNAFMRIALPTLTAIIGTALVWVSAKKKSRSHSLLRPRSLKTGGILLCVLISSIILLTPIVTVSAELQQGKVIVWGSESTGAYDPNFGSNHNWRKNMTEIGLQQSIASNITWNDFNCSGYYDAYNHQGGGTVKSSVLFYLSLLHESHAPIVVVDFDHGVGRNDTSQAPGEFHFMFEDQVGTGIGTNASYYWDPENGIYDMEIYPLVDKGQVLLAFINTCMSANTTNPYTGETWQGNGTYGALGMPFAWTHRNVTDLYSGDFNVENDISNDGYRYPDSGHQVYIGFPFGSASLMQFIPYESGTKQYYRWVNDTFYYALHYDISVNDALDQASLLMWEEDFGNSQLSDFTAYWWNMKPSETMDNSSMVVYGNGNVHLKLYGLTVNSPVAPADVYIDGRYRGTTGNTFAVDSGSHSVQVDSSTNVFHNFEGYPEFQNPTTVSVTSDTTVQANYYANPPPQYTLSISSGQGGTTDPTLGNHQYTPGLVPVTAIPNEEEGYFFDHWLLDGQSYTQNPITVTMTSNHTLEAYFVLPPYRCVRSIHDYGSSGFQAGVSDPDTLIGISNDGQYATLYAGAYYDEAWIIGNMNTQATGHIKLYCSGYSSHLRVYVSSDGSNYNLVSDQYVSQGSPGWIDCGLYSGTFSYIAVDVYADPPLLAIYVDSVRVDPPANYALTISSGSGGSTTPSPGAYQYTEGTPVAVTANPNSGYVLDYWLLDGQNAGAQNPITVTMNSNRSLQANFCQVPQHSLTVLAYNQYSEPGYVPLYIDSQYVGTTGYAYSVTDGNHQIYVEDPVFDGYFFHYFDHYYYDGGSDYNNPTTLSVTSDKTVTAYYNSWY